MAEKKTHAELTRRIGAHLEQGDVHSATELALEALEASGWPESGEPIPLIRDLDSAQRDLALALAGLTPLHIGDYAIPIAARVRQRWLGVTPAGPLEWEQRFEVEGEQVSWPLWRFLADEDVDEDDKLERIEGLGEAERLKVLAELVLESYEIDLDFAGLLETAVDSASGAGAEWAAAFADELLDLFADAPSIEANQFQRIADELKLLVIMPLMRAGVAIESRWEVFVPVTKNRARMEEIVQALAPERRVPVMLARLDETLAQTAVTVALDVLAYLPEEAIVAKVRGWLGDKEWERNLGRDFTRAARRRLKEIEAML